MIHRGFGVVEIAGYLVVQVALSLVLVPLGVAPRQLRQAPEAGAVHVADLDVRLGDRRDRVRDAVSRGAGAARDLATLSVQLEHLVPREGPVEDLKIVDRGRQMDP